MAIVMASASLPVYDTLETPLIDELISEVPALNTKDVIEHQDLIETARKVSTVVNEKDKIVKAKTETLNTLNQDLKKDWFGDNCTAKAIDYTCKTLTGVSYLFSIAVIFFDKLTDQNKTGWKVGVIAALITSVVLSALTALVWYLRERNEKKREEIKVKQTEMRFTENELIHLKQFASHMESLSAVKSAEQIETNIKEQANLHPAFNQKFLPPAQNLIVPQIVQLDNKDPLKQEYLEMKSLAVQQSSHRTEGRIGKSNAHPEKKDLEADHHKEKSRLEAAKPGEEQQETIQKEHTRKHHHRHKSHDGRTTPQGKEDKKQHLEPTVTGGELKRKSITTFEGGSQLFPESATFASSTGYKRASYVPSDMPVLNTQKIPSPRKELRHRVNLMQKRFGVYLPYMNCEGIVVENTGDVLDKPPTQARSLLNAVKENIPTFKATNLSEGQDPISTLV